MQQVKDLPKNKKQEKIFLECGEEFTPEVEAELVAEAERGYDLSKAKLVFARIPLTYARSQIELDAVRERAEREGRPMDEVAQEMLKP